MPANDQAADQKKPVRAVVRNNGSILDPRWVLTSRGDLVGTPLRKGGGCADSGSRALHAPNILAQRGLVLCAIAHSGIAISTKAGIELAFGELCRRAGDVRSDRGRARFGVNAPSDSLCVVVGHRPVTPAGRRFEAPAAEGPDLAAGIADESSPLQGARGDGYRAPLHAEHVGQELVGQTEMICAGALPAWPGAA